MTDKQIARYDGPRTIADLDKYAQLLAFDRNPEGAFKQNNALPVAYRGNPAALAFATEYAKALDVSPVTAIVGIHYIDGKPAASAGLVSALVRRAGHRIRTWIEGSIEDGTAKAVTTITRVDDPDYEYRSEWTLSRAVRAELMKRTDDGRIVAAKSGSGWSKYPENMLKSRTITECARDAAEDAILGVHYTPEELGVETDEAGEPIVVESVVVSQERPREQRQQSGTTPRPPTEAAKEPETKPVAEIDLDALREDALAAATPADLAEVWSAYGLKRDLAATLKIGDRDSVETTVLDLFAALGRDLADESTDDDDVVDAEVVEETERAPEGDSTVVTSANVTTLLEAVAKSRQTEARAALDVAMQALPKYAAGEVAKWAREEGVNPATSPANTAYVLGGIAASTPFSDETLRDLGSEGIDPAAVVVTSIRDNLKIESRENRARLADEARNAARH